MPPDPQKEPPTKKATPHHHGHRDRLRKRFRETNGEGMPDYEIMELILFNVVQRRDVKELAKTLTIDKFKGFTGALAATESQIKDIPGLGAKSAQRLITEFALIRMAATRLAREKVINRTVLSSWDALIEYCSITMAHNDIEQFRILFLDTKNTLIADEVHQQGTVNHTPAYPREIVKRALNLGASGMILVHNHPSGDPTPSRADIEMTRKIAESALPLGISLHDHLIIGKGKHTSFKERGLI
ncbi:MAG: DNA repair protein RadC [Parvularculales bacterium]